jgi:hypothetical protein
MFIKIYNHFTMIEKLNDGLIFILKVEDNNFNLKKQYINLITLIINL